MATISISPPVHYLHTAIIEDNNHSVAELYARHRDFLYRVAMRMLRNSDDAEDVVQNVFLRMMRNDHAPDEGRSAVGYLRRAARNAAIDLIRKRGQRAEMELGSYYPAADEGFVRRRHVRQVMERLPARNAQLIEMHYRDGYMYEELADRLGMQVGTVKSRLHRIRAVLQEELWAA